MDRRRVLALVLVLLLSPLVPRPEVLAAEPEPGRGLEEVANFALASDAIGQAAAQRAGASWNDLDEATRAAVLQQLNWAKAERERLASQLRQDLAEVSGSDQLCERELLRASHHRKDALLAKYVYELRKVRGDRRSGLRKLGDDLGRYVVRPLGRIIEEAAKEALPELAAMYLSGGTLNRAAFRAVGKRNLLRVARDRVQNVALRALSRQVQSVETVSVDAARGICEEQRATPTAPAPAGDAEAPAIPAGTYTGSFDDALILGATWSDGDSRVERNLIELRVAEDGSVSGGFVTQEQGFRHDVLRCPGGGSTYAYEIDPGQRIGPALPQGLSGSIEITLMESYFFRSTEEGIEEYCVDPSPTSYADQGDILLTGYADGRVAGTVDDWPFELTLGEPASGSDEDAPWDRE